MDIKMLDPKVLIPYKGNVKKHSKEQISNVAASIKAFGFVQPVVVDKNNVIVIGHSRTLAAKQLGMKEIPVVVADSLSEEEVRALRIADNKLNESAWDAKALEMELGEIVWDTWDMDFDFTGDTRRRSAWSSVEIRCDLKKKIEQYASGGYIYTSFFRASKEGALLEDIKTDRGNVALFADCLVDYIRMAYGRLGESWCLLTTPPRRHKEFHFATAVCEKAAADLGIPFYKGAVEAVNRHRVGAEFVKRANPVEDNIIIFDDIKTTGETMRLTRELFEADHVVVPIIAIKNK